MNAYVLDTSALIGAWARSYPPDNFPNFWINMDAAAQEGRLLVPQEVHRELERKQDELLQWVRDRWARQERRPQGALASAALERPPSD